MGGAGRNRKPLLKKISPEIGKHFGASDFKADRLNKQQRKSAGLDLSKRKYNKLFRILARLEKTTDCHY